MQETDILGEHLLDSNKTDENCIYFSNNDLESAQEDVLDLSLGNVLLHSTPKIVNKYGLDLTVNRNKDNTTIFDDNNQFVKNHVYKLLPITLEEIDEELIHMEHDYCNISSGSDKEAEFSRSIEISLIKSRVYRKKRDKSSKKGTKNVDFENCQERTTTESCSNELDIVTDLEKDSQLIELDFSLINLCASISMHHSEIDYRKLLQPLDLTPNITEEKKTEDILEENRLEDKDETCSPELNIPEVDINAEDSNNIVVGLMRPNCKDYKPCKKFLSEITYLVPYLVKNDCGKINILDLSSENVGNSNERRTFYFVSEDHWKSFQNSSERIILTNDKSIGKPVSTNEKDDGAITYLLFDENSLRDSLAKHCQDIGADLNYRVLKDFNGELSESNITSGDEEIDDGEDQNLVPLTVESEDLNNETVNVIESIESNGQPGGVINSGLLKKLLSKCSTSISNGETLSGRIKCNECFEAMNPCSKCLGSMTKTYFNRTSQNSDKHFRNLSSKKHWSRMVNIEDILNSNPIVKEMKSKEGNKKKKLKGKSAKKKNTSNSSEKSNSKEEKKKDLEAPRVEKSNGIINSGFLKALLANSNNEPNTVIVNHLNNEITDYLVDQSDVYNLDQVSTSMCSDSRLYEISSFVEYSNALGKSNEINFDKSDESPINRNGNQDLNQMLDSVEGPSLKHKNAQEVGKANKSLMQSSTLKKPRRSLDISIEEIADLGLGVEKRTRSGREAPEVLNEKKNNKKCNKKDLVSCKIEYRDKNVAIIKDMGGNKKKLVGNKASHTQNILNSLLLDAAKKITEPSEAPILCDILPNMENLNIPIPESNTNSDKNQKKIKNKKSVGGKTKKFSKKAKKINLIRTAEPNDIKLGTINNEEPDNNLETSDNDKTEEMKMDDSSEQNVLFFENNLNLDENKKSQMELKMCLELENNIAQDLGILSNGFNDSCDTEKRGRPTNILLKNNNCSDLEASEKNNHDNLPAENVNEVDIANQNPSPAFSNTNVEEKNNGINGVMLRFKNTISEKMKTAENNNEGSCNSASKKVRGRPRKYVLENDGSDLKNVDDNNHESSCTEVENSGISRSSSDFLKPNLGDIEADFREIDIQIKKQANERQNIELNGNNSKDSNDSSEKLEGGLITESLVRKDINCEAEPFRNRLRSKNKIDSTPANIEMNDVNQFENRTQANLEELQDPRKKLKKRNKVSDASKSCRKRKRSRESVENLLGNSLNDSIETSQQNKKVYCELLGKFINPPLENTEKSEEKSLGDPVLDSSLSYERTTRSGKTIESSTVAENVKIEPPSKKRNHELALLNIEEPEPEILRKTEINLRRRTVDRSSLVENGKRQIEENSTDNLALKKRKSEEPTSEAKNEINKNGKVPGTRFSARLQNK